MLSRVSWPRFPLEVLLDALSAQQGAFARVCIQSTVGRDAFRELLAAVDAVRQRCSLPLDVSALPPDSEAADALIGAGVDHIGFGLDAATPEVFRRVKGRGWERYQSLIAHVAEEHPGRAAVHLIAGLGETERELVEAVQRYSDRGAVVGLFAFCPIAGTRMASSPPPSLDSYRRLQAARYLIAAGAASVAEMEFESRGRLARLPESAKALIAPGEAFRTSGCPGCNRPFYNERPGGPQYNYARPLAPDEARAALQESGLWADEGSSGDE